MFNIHPADSDHFLSPCENCRASTSKLEHIKLVLSCWTLQAVCESSLHRKFEGQGDQKRDQLSPERHCNIVTTDLDYSLFHWFEHDSNLV
jgi:hypothetical protein